MFLPISYCNCIFAIFINFLISPIRMLLSRGKTVKKRKSNPNESTQENNNSIRRHSSILDNCSAMMPRRQVEAHSVLNRSLKLVSTDRTEIGDDTKAGEKPDCHQRSNIPLNKNPYRFPKLDFTDTTDPSDKAVQKPDSHQISNTPSNTITKTSIRKLTWSTLKRILLPFLTESEMMSIHQFTRGKSVQSIFCILAMKFQIT